VFVRTAEPLAVNRVLALRFRLPGLAEEFRVRGKVVWSNPRSGRSYPQGMGIHFLELPPDLGKRIAAFVADMRRDLGLERLSDLFGRPLGEADRQGGLA
ncbi:MAG: PilZ domain-containing protein, partial [Candidatus Methylomirabilales bacterium]